MREFPDTYALREKGLQRQIAVGTLVSSQEQRAAVVPRINRLPTADKPRVLFFHRFIQGFVCSCVRRVVQTVVLDALEQERRLIPGRTDPSASSRVRPRSAPTSCCAPPRPDPLVVCPGFGLDSFVFLGSDV